MKITITDANKMRSHIDKYAFTNINNENFKDWIDYIKLYSTWIEEAKDEFDGYVFYANLTLIVDEEDYYVDVIFTFNCNYTEVEIDLDYSRYIDHEDYYKIRKI